MTLTPAQREMVNASVQAGRDAALEQTPTLKPGVVMAVDPTNTVADVTADGPDTTTFPADVVCSTVLHPGDRVMLLFVPPHGCMVLGRRSGDWDDWHIVGTEGEPTFFTGWAHAAGTNPPGQDTPAQVMFTRRGDRTELRGRASSTGSSLPVFALPEGYRPENDLLVPALTTLGAHTILAIDKAAGHVAVASAGIDEIIFDGISYICRSPETP